MKKFAVVRKEINYYVDIVEAKSKPAAMRSRTTYNNKLKVPVSLNWSQNAHAKEWNGEEYFYSCLDTPAAMDTEGFSLINEKDAETFIENWEKEHGWKPSLVDLQPCLGK